MTGLFFSFDGVDGVGKSTQIRLLQNWFAQRGDSVVLCRDPGSTELGEQLRSLLLDKPEMRIADVAEMLLYMASRAQLVQEVILPALRAGKTVISDRFLLANLVYQGYAGSVPLESLRMVGELATYQCQPDLTFLLDMPASQAFERIQRGPDRMEAKGLEYLGRVRAGFLAEARLHPERIVAIDAGREPHLVHADVLAAITRVASRSTDKPHGQLPTRQL